MYIFKTADFIMYFPIPKYKIKWKLQNFWPFDIYPQPPKTFRWMEHLGSEKDYVLLLLPTIYWKEKKRKKERKNFLEHFVEPFLYSTRSRVSITWRYCWSSRIPPKPQEFRMVGRWWEAKADKCLYFRAQKPGLKILGMSGYQSGTQSWGSRVLLRQ